jgi:type I restriction enzyme S subunit
MISDQGNDMDAEVTALEGKLSKTREVKAGMMSVLLSGKNTISGKLKVMDAEISALEEKLSKARQVKAGMMSVLLTGRIRLVES